MKNLIVITVIISLFLLSCSESEPRPSRQVLQQSLKQDSTAERIDVNSIKSWAQSFQIFRRSSDSSYLDLQSDWNKNLVKQPEYAGISCTYDAEAVNDSILFITEFDPLLEKMDKEGSYSGIQARDRKYIFHSNGDIEMKMGNMVSREENDEDDGTFMRAYLDGATGLVVSYWKNDWGQDNTYHITESGKVKIGDDYGYPSRTKNLAAYTLQMLGNDLRLILLKMKNN